MTWRRTCVMSNDTWRIVQGKSVLTPAASLAHGRGLLRSTKAEGWGGLLRPNTNEQVSFMGRPEFCAAIFFVLLGADHVSIIRTPSPPRVLGNCASWGFTLPAVFCCPAGSALAEPVKGYVAAGRMRQWGWCGPITPPMLLWNIHRVESKSSWEFDKLIT